jgi:hypothetical protein
MKTTWKLTGALLAAVCGTSLTLAQAPSLLPPVKPAEASFSEASFAPVPPEAAILGAIDADSPVGHGHHGVATCCGPVGGNGPINAEVYFQSGANFILSDTAFGRSLKTGYEIQGGGRSLFFNTDRSGAFIVDLGLLFTRNDGKPESTFDFSGAPVTLRNLDRTSVLLGLGYDWFLHGPGSTGSGEGKNLRVGFDGGARWGTSHLDMNIVGVDNGYLRQQDVFAAFYAGVHADIVVPVGAWNFLVGARGQWSYTSLDVIESTNTSIHDLSALLTFGFQW